MPRRCPSCLALAGLLFAPILAAGDGALAPFLGEPAIETQRIFEGERFPNIVVTPTGTVVAS